MLDEINTENYSGPEVAGVVATPVVVAASEVAPNPSQERDYEAKQQFKEDEAKREQARLEDLATRRAALADGLDLSKAEDAKKLKAFQEVFDLTFGLSESDVEHLIATHAKLKSAAPVA